ncbi:E2 protein [Papillomaviridae sp. Seabass_c1851]|nr:E2 protein [Papillomaviridae sp. Seabass_c1851]
MDELIKLERASFLGRYKVKTLQSGIEQLKREILYFEAAIKYREENKLPRHLFQAVHNRKAIQIPSLTALESLLQQAQSFLPKLESLKQSGVASGVFQYKDLQPRAFEEQPKGTIKQGGHYSPNGYPTYLALYMELRDGWNKLKPESDADGFYFMHGNKKVYYFRFQGPPSPPPTQPKKKKAKKKHQASPDKGAAHHVVTKGHGLSLLLAQAKDPPGIEIRGPTEVLKGQRRRIKAKGGFKDISGIFHWKSHSDACFIVLFDSSKQREEFLQRKTTSKITLRLCSFK